MKITKIKEIIDKKEIVSFDIFDTLLFRNIYKPTDLFKILGKEVEEKYGIEGFHSLRISCEADSRNAENKNETSLDEIYQLMEERIKRDVQWIKKREIELELEFTDFNPFMKEVFDYAVKTKKRIVLVSDMYLPSELVKKLLKKTGYKDAPIYISCEYHAGKGTKELYEVVLEKEKLDKTKWVHIGDNKYSDYEKAKEFGIEAIWYENVCSKDKLPEPTTVESSIIRGIQDNYLYNGNELEYWERFGVLYASPIYYGFANWLFKLTRNKDNLFFLARDGYTVKKVYDLLKDKRGAKIDTYYLYGSRKAFQLPSLLHKTKDETIDFLVSFTYDYDVTVTVEDVLKSLHLDHEKYVDDLKIFGFNAKDDLINENNYLQLKQFIKHIYPDIEVYLKEQEGLVLDYLKQEGLDKYKKINVMDVGWSGSLQEGIRILTGKDVMGYYFGTVPTKKVDIMSNSLGFAFDEAKPDKYFTTIFYVPMMYEFVFSAPHGTTIGFKKKGTKIVAELDESDGEYVKIINTLQNSALIVIKKYLQYADYLEEMNVEDTISAYRDMIARKDYKDLVEFRKLTNSVLYFNKKESYVDEFDENYVYSYYDDFLKKINKAMWKDAYLVKGVKNEKQWNEYKARLEKQLFKRKLKVTNKGHYIKEGIKNPKKVIDVVKKIVKR